MCKWFHFICLIIFILCVLCTALGGQALTVLFLKIGTLYWHRKKIKFLTVCDFITSGTACSVLWNVPSPHCHLFHFWLFVFMLWKNKDQKGIPVQSVSSSIGKETAKIQAHANVSPLVMLCLNGAQAAHEVGMFVLWCYDKHWVCLLFTTFPPFNLTLSSCFLHPRTWTHKLLLVEQRLSHSTLY